MHEFSPNLKKMVKELYNKTGLESDTYPVYGFKTRDPDPEKEEGCLTKAFSEVFNMMADTPNAAAAYETKPIIMISEVALRILDNNEEYAVLAHEFAHIGANHNFVGKMHRLIGSVARSSNAFLRASEMVAAGWKGILSSFTFVLSTGTYFKKLHPNSDLLQDDYKIDTVGEFQLKKNMKLNQSYLNTIGVTFALTAFNPKYLGVYLATKALNESTILVEKRLSRSKEYQADAGAIKLGANPLALITALRKITKLYERSMINEYGFNPSTVQTGDPLTNGYKKLKRTHPTLKKRFNAIAKIAKRKGYSASEIDHTINGRISIPHYVDDISPKVLEMMMKRL
jgi:heat shock protein HtpX